MSLVTLIGADAFIVCETFLDSDDADFDFTSSSKAPTLPPGEEDCNEDEREYISGLELDATISLVFTILMIFKACLVYHKTRDCCGCGSCGCDQHHASSDEPDARHVLPTTTVPYENGATRTTVTETTRGWDQEYSRRSPTSEWIHDGDCEGNQLIFGSASNR